MNVPLLIAGSVGLLLGVSLAMFLRREGPDTEESAAAGEGAQLAAILASMTEGVVAVDREQMVLHMNAEAERIFDRRSIQCVGAPVWKIIRNPEILDMLEATLDTGLEQEREMLIPSSGGAPVRRMEVRVAALRQGDGERGGAVMVFHDVTRLRHLESVRRDFVANVSHEIKTPVASIRGMVETMLDDREMDPDTQTRFLQRVFAQTRRMGRLIDDLLALSRFEDDELPLRRDRIDMRRTIEEAVEQIQPAAQKKELCLVAELPSDESFPVEADQEALRLVFDNLLSNAVRYTPEGGRVTVSLKKVGKQVWSEVSDTGIGIEEEHLDRIFERFYRVDKARSRELGGTGLGLSIVKHITARLGGGVLVQSRVGEGSSFRVHLPLAE